MIGYLVGFIDLALERYKRSVGRPVVTSQEFEESHHLDRRTARAVRELMHSVPWVTDGGSSNVEGWSVTIAHEVTRWEGLAGTDDLLERLQRLKQEGEEHLAALSDAISPLIHPPSLTSESTEAQLRRSERIARYLESHPWIRIVAITAVPLGVVIGIVSLRA